MKVFQGNYDGRRYAAVAAKNQREAAALLGMSVYGFRQFFSDAASDETVSVAMSAPGQVFLRDMRNGSEWVMQPTREQ